VKRIVLGVLVLACLARVSMAAGKPACTYTPTGPVDFFVSTANTSTLTVRASTTECAKPLLDAEHLTLSNAANVTMTAQVVASAPPSTASLELTISKVPKLQAGSSEWHLRRPGSADDLGTLVIEAFELEVKELVVSYADVRLEAKQDGLGVKTDQGFISVARPFGNAAASSVASAKVTIVNTANIAAPAGVVHPGDDRSHYWRVVRSTWGSSVRFQCQDDKPPRSPLNGIDGPGVECPVNLGRIRYFVSRRLKTPLVVTLELVQLRKPDPALLTSVDLTLSAEARPESIPLPITEAVTVQCTADRWKLDHPVSTAQRGGSIAIDDDALERGRCQLRIDYGKLTTTSPNLGRFLDVYGDQALEITVARGKKKASFTVVVVPTDPAVSVPLVAPEEAADESGPYHVSVRLVAGRKDVHYRNPLPSAATDQVEDPRLTFHATLRPRGRHGFTYPVRMYVTFPVTPVTLRFPPRAAMLSASSQSSMVQVETVRAGAMFAIEPWDYDSDRNPLRLPISLQGGLSFLRFQDKPVQFSLLMGVSLDFPIIDKSYTETSIAIGVFYEIGLEERWRDANRGYVITAGLDLFRAFKTNAKSEK
jgi:hypothetical protein